MKNYRSIVLAALVIVVSIAATSFARKSNKSITIKLAGLNDNDSICFIPHIIEKIDIIDFGGRESSYKIKETLLPINDIDAVICDSIFSSMINNGSLRFEKEWNSTTLASLYYSPDFYVECFIKNDDGLSLRYTLYYDSQKNMFHLTRAKGKTVYYSGLYNTSEYANFDSFFRMLNNICKPNVTRYTPTMIDGSLFFQQKTSEFINNAITEWTLEKVALLDPFKSDGDKIQGFGVVAEKSAKPVNIQEIRKLLLASENYKQSNMVKNATFLPDYACRFTNNDETVDVLVALYCDDLKIYYKSEVYTLDITPSHKKFADFIKNMFPLDNFLKKY